MNEDLCFDSIIKYFYQELAFKCNLDKSSYYNDAFRLKTQYGARRIVDLLSTITDAD